MRYAESRRKSCQQCSKAKAKCDRKALRCSRCIQRKLQCSYPQSLHSSRPASSIGPQYDTNVETAPLASPKLDLSHDWLPDQTFDQPLTSGTNINLDDPLSNAEDSTSTIGGTWMKAVEAAPNLEHVSYASARISTTRETYDFTDLTLVCPINAKEISNRWLNQFVPLPGQKVKNYPANVGSFIYKILKSYATVCIHGRGMPPFVHQSQMMTNIIRSPLSTCLSLVRICQQSLSGAISNIADVLEREMNKLYEQHNAQSDLDVLATFQAYLIYAMVLFFQLGQGRDSLLRQAMMNLQELAYVTSQQGLVCIAEREGIRPRWEAWIIAESKRRTLYTMYLFDSVLSTYEGLPTFLGSELEGLPAPANKLLWQSNCRTDWHKLYSRHLSEWSDGSLRIDELWPMVPELDDAQRATRSIRVAQWLENLDEYGMMLYTVTSCTHGV